MKRKRKFSHYKLKQVQIRVIEQEYYDKLNSGINQWQQNYKHNTITIG